MPTTGKDSHDITQHVCKPFAERSRRAALQPGGRRRDRSSGRSRRCFGRDGRRPGPSDTRKRSSDQIIATMIGADGRSVTWRGGEMGNGWRRCGTGAAPAVGYTTRTIVGLLPEGSFVLFCNIYKGIIYWVSHEEVPVLELIYYTLRSLYKPKTVITYTYYVKEIPLSIRTMTH